MKRSIFCIIFAVVVLMAACPCYAEGRHSYKPSGGFVPDEKTAVAFAEAVLRPIYGDRMVDQEKPFHAELNGDVWTVTGTLNCPQPEKCLGGVGVVEISKDDGKIIRASHGK